MDSQRQNFYQNARKYTTRVSADVSREISHSPQMPVTSSPFPVSRMTFLYFVSFFFLKFRVSRSVNDDVNLSIKKRMVIKSPHPKKQQQQQQLFPLLIYFPK
jgi:hypothetical protein